MADKGNTGTVNLIEHQTVSKYDVKNSYNLAVH